MFVINPVNGCGTVCVVDVCGAESAPVYTCPATWLLQGNNGVCLLPRRVTSDDKSEDADEVAVTERFITHRETPLLEDLKDVRSTIHHTRHSYGGSAI